MEEAAFMRKDLFYKTIAPMLVEKKTSLICISSVTEPNFYSEMFEKKDEYGNHIYDVLKMNNICKKCDIRKERYANQGIIPKNLVCTHLSMNLPEWNDQSQMKRLKEMYEIAGEGNLFQNELCGESLSIINTAYKTELVDNLVKKRPFQENIVPKLIVMAIDPNNGGAGSDTAIISGYFHQDKYIICGLDSRPTTPQERDQFLLAHIEALRSVKRFKTSTILFVPENNLDGNIYSTLRLLGPLPNVKCYIDSDLKEGLRTKVNSKMAYTHKAIDILKQNACFFDLDITCNYLFCNPATEIIGLKSKLEMQLRSWKISMTGSPTKPYFTCGGKTDNSGKVVAGKKDDLAMTFVLAMWVLQICKSDENYLFSNHFENIF
ncbi:MAG: hypothetical protein EOP34_03365 [Rickettsiales bacterium]|nr:MAG: hypothetical protein EOP34_03365 [Rickettsiales bacterium]